jgi:serine/threonine protein kinase
MNGKHFVAILILALLKQAYPKPIQGCLLSHAFDDKFKKNLGGKKLIEMFNNSKVTLGKGSFGVVNEIKWKNIKGEEISVAVKRVELESDFEHDIMSKEIGILNTLKNLPEIMNLHGCVQEARIKTVTEIKSGIKYETNFKISHVYLVLEKLYLDFEENKDESKSLYAKLKNLRVDQRMEVYLKFYQALQVLHSKDFVHSDFKPANIMSADENMQEIKLIDFGLSNNNNRSSIGHSPCYAPIEAFGTHVLKFSFDVYGWGVSVAAIETGLSNYYSKSNQFYIDTNKQYNKEFVTKIFNYFKDNLRNVPYLSLPSPPIDKYSKEGDSFYKLIMACLAFYESQRPDDQSIIDRLKAIITVTKNQLELENKQKIIAPPQSQIKIDQTVNKVSLPVHPTQNVVKPIEKEYRAPIYVNDYKPTPMRRMYYPLNGEPYEIFDNNQIPNYAAIKPLLPIEKVGELRQENIKEPLEKQGKLGIQNPQNENIPSGNRPLGAQREPIVKENSKEVVPVVEKNNLKEDNRVNIKLATIHPKVIPVEIKYDQRYLQTKTDEDIFKYIKPLQKNLPDITKKTIDNGVVVLENVQNELKSDKKSEELINPIVNNEIQFDILPSRPVCKEIESDALKQDPKPTGRQLIVRDKDKINNNGKKLLSRSPKANPNKVDLIQNPIPLDNLPTSFESDEVGIPIVFSPVEIAAPVAGICSKDPNLDNKDLQAGKNENSYLKILLLGGVGLAVVAAAVGFILHSRRNKV